MQGSEGERDLPRQILNPCGFSDKMENGYTMRGKLHPHTGGFVAVATQHNDGKWPFLHLKRCTLLILTTKTATKLPVQDEAKDTEAVPLNGVARLSSSP
jgi:hypothetical protein